VARDRKIVEVGGRYRISGEWVAMMPISELIERQKTKGSSREEEPYSGLGTKTIKSGDLRAGLNCGRWIPTVRKKLRKKRFFQGTLGLQVARDQKLSL